MIPFIIAGAIGYVVGKLFEEDKAPKYADGGGTLFAPNGKPSNLTPEQYKLVRTPAFKKWFGDWENSPENASKVVDENGEPKVKWRGDNNPKNVFDYINYGGHGVYYFGDVGFAESFGDKLRTYFINCRNPFLPNKTTEKQEKEIRNLLEKDANKILTEIIENNGFKNLYDFLDNYYLIEEGFNENSKPLDILLYQFKNGINYFILEINSIIEWIKNNDYDGYESYEGNYDNIAVFNSNQIKLADGTNTTFDSNNNDIRYAGGGGTQPKDLTTINNFENIQKGVDYYSYSDSLEKQEKADRWYELFIKNQKEQIITSEEFKEFISLSNELVWEDLG
jgi:hypothetical protein